jgi:hypothetical protein
MQQFSSLPAEGQEPEPSLLAGLHFDLDGEVFHCNGRVKLFQLSYAARKARDGDQVAQASMFAETLVMALGDEEFARFHDHVTARGTPDEVVIAIADWIDKEAEKRAKDEAGRPTPRRSPSSSGQPDQGGRMSRVISLGGGDVTVLRPGMDGYLDELPDEQQQQVPPGLTGKQPAKTSVKAKPARKSPSGRRAG